MPDYKIDRKLRSYVSAALCEEDELREAIVMELGEILATEPELLLAEALTTMAGLVGALISHYTGVATLSDIVPEWAEFSMDLEESLLLDGE